MLLNFKLYFFSLLAAMLLGNLLWPKENLYAKALTIQPGNPERGLKVIRDGSKTSCLICHSISQLPDRNQGQLGPTLNGVGSKFTEEELRLRITDARKINKNTIMPPYLSDKDLFRVAPKWQGKTIYQPQELEDVISFLLSLKI
mgnify:CR=1 FL=1|jgi:L-cysteine S-thiosulfotransferase|tara:strand:+ start:117 stop:548 length:432 start_codon:yes stop_codon:yes gene_type:complete